MKTTAKETRRVVDVIATQEDALVLIERLNFPSGFAFSGGKIEDGERPIKAAIREFFEETGMRLTNVRYFKTVSSKTRDPRYYTIDRIYTGEAIGAPKNEAGKTRVFLTSRDDALSLPKERFAFDHFEILQAFLKK